ncbi:hypothetical protein KKH39_00005, partial [Patescibacteria group bacterium]|nr:hypothetical protein [Patescibacteria group bacterium]
MKKWGFTLIEAIIVVSIITVVMGAVFVSLNPTKRFGQSNDGRRWADLATISKAVDIYTADNGAAPSDFASSTVAVGMKVVLCDSSATLTCDGDTYGCLVVDDTSFLGTYLPAIPVDPSKTDASDSGYYMTRESSGAISFGSCSSYSGEDVKVISAINMTAYSVTCGDGLTQATEVCDDGDTFSEGCGNGVIETNGTYCNSTCSAVIVVGVSEVCDSLL